MILYLSQFQLDLRYLKGVRNFTADCLSRCFEDMTNEDRVELQQTPDSEEFIVAVDKTQNQQAETATESLFSTAQKSSEKLPETVQQENERTNELIIDRQKTLLQLPPMLNPRAECFFYHERRRSIQKIDRR